MKTLKCQTCGKKLKPLCPCQIKQGRGKFCSNKCHTIKKKLNLSLYPQRTALHLWLKRNYGNPSKCEKCGVKGSHKSHKGKQRKSWSICWANKDHKYRRNRKDFIGLCYKCHRKYDIKFNNFISQHTFQKGNTINLGRKRPDMVGKNNPMNRKLHSTKIKPYASNIR